MIITIRIDKALMNYDPDNMDIYIGVHDCRERLIMRATGGGDSDVMRWNPPVRAIEFFDALQAVIEEGRNGCVRVVFDAREFYRDEP